MTRTFVGLGLLALVALAGCEKKNTAGGPGATNPDAKAPLYGEGENTFNLTAPSMNLKQGETKPISVDIKRGTNFQEDVTIKLVDLPQGLSIEPVSPVIKHGETAASIKFRAAADAALGVFTVKVIGHPTKGGDSSTELKITIAKDPEVAAKVKRDEYAAELQKQLGDLDAKFEALKVSCSKAEGQSKKDLEKKVEEAKVKRDLAAKKLADLKDAAPDRWEKMKDGAASAFDDLKKMFQ